MKARDYCCCAFPLVNAGIYAILLEQLVLGSVVGLLSMTTPSIVGASVFTGAQWVLGILCLIGAGLQVIGFISVKSAKMSLFRRYAQFHLIITVGALAVSAAWTIISVIGHNKAQSKCVKDFFGDADGSLKSQGQTLCTIFSYVDVGIMGGLTLVFTITLFYFYVLIVAYPASYKQQSGYKTVSSSMGFPNDPIPMDTRDIYPTDPKSQEYSHNRQDSASSLQDVMNEPVQRSHEGYSQRSYDADSYHPSHPNNAYTQEPGPTPGYQNAQFGGAGGYGDASVNRPADAKYHPAEGSFGRKMPRMMQENAYTPYPYS